MTVAQAGKAWAGFGRRPVSTGLLAAWLSQKPRAHIPLLSPLSCSSATGRGPFTAPAGFCSHGRKACLSTVEELPPKGGKKSCGQTLMREPRGAAQVSRTNIAHLFLLTGETSKLMN